MRSALLLSCLLVVLTACSEMPKVTPADRHYLFFAADIDQFPIAQYRHRTTPEQLPYFFLKGYTEQHGYMSWYGTILIGGDGREVKYLCLVNVMPKATDAQGYFGRLTPEPSPTRYGMEETVDPGLYQADEVYLYRDDTYFHLIVRSSRVVYAIVVQGAHVEERQVRSGLRSKILYLTVHPSSIR